MDTNAQTITTMGIISNEVYNTTPSKDYFSDTPDNLIANGTTYKVLDHTPTTDSGFNALLLQDTTTGKYVIAFRGTETNSADILTDLVIAGHYNAQYSDAVAFVNNVLGKTYKDANGNDVTVNKESLTLTGHSLGGILTQQVGATMRIPGVAFNPYGANALITYPPTTNIFLAILNVVNGANAAAWAANNIINVSYQDDGDLHGDPLSNLATALSSKHLGDFIPIWGNDLGLSAHSMSVLNNAISTYNALLYGTNSSIGYVELSKAFAANAFTDKDDFNRTAQTIGTYLTGNESASIELLQDYSAQQIISLAKTDKSIAYALEQLNGFIIKGTNYTDVKDYNLVSQNYLNDRVDFILNTNEESIYHYDQKTDIGVGQTNATNPGNYSRVVFVSDNYVYAPVYGKTYGKLTFYGNEKDNNITAKSRADNYAEGGLGSDTITTGMGNDTIYTNANISDQYDQETSSTVNRVYAGDGEDHIYGSKGTDIIYADSDSTNPDEYHESDFVEGKGGSDVIYGGGDDDILYADSKTSHTDTSGDYIVGGLGADKIYGSDGDDTIYGDKDTDLDDGSIWKDNDTIYGYGGDDTIYGGVDEDTIDGGIGNDTLKGGEGDDVLLGGVGMDQLYGGIDNDRLLGGDDTSTDILLGGSGQDTLLGQGGDDVLAGGDSWSDLYSEKEHDYLLGGSGFDTYYVSNSDTINDVDYSGLIMFNDKSLGGKKRKVDDAGTTYEDDYFVYALNGNDMVVVEKATQEYITIENFNFNSVGFGIDFSESDPDKQDIELRVSDASTTEGGDLVFAVSINHALKYDLTVDVASYFNSTASKEDVTGTLSGTVTIKAGETSANFTPIDTVDDTIEEPTEKFLFAATGYKYAGENQQDNDLGSLLIMNAAEGTIKDNETKTPLEVSVSDASLDESNANMTFTVSLKGVLEDGESLTVDFQTADNTATASYDYASTQKSVTFTTDSMTQTIEVPIYDDSYKEGDETFWLTPVSSSGYNGTKDIIFKNAGEGTIIDNDTNGQVVIEVSSTSADEGDSGTQSASVTISISQALKDDLFVNMSDGNSYKIAAGSTSTTAQVFWGAGVVDTVVDSDGPVTLDIVDFDYFGSDNPNIVTGHGGKVNIIDDDSNDHKPPYDSHKGGMQDPLVLDSDKDGFISTISLEDSNAYFDITGDGTKEKIGWIAPNDGILVYDKNENGQIDGIDEVFGNATTSGFEELAKTADSNFDGKIDRRDELYSRLKVWHDDNGDGISQSEELKTLKEEDVKAIELNVVGTNINVNGNRISEAGRYQDTQGNRELTADLQLQYVNRLEDKPEVTAEDLSVIDPITYGLANLRGYGYVSNTFEAYNSNEEFKALAQDFAANKKKGATNFQEFLAE